MSERPTLTSAITAALATAQYEQLEDGSYFGRIPNYPGVLAFAPTLAACREELQSTLEDWLFLGLKLNHPLPAEGHKTIEALNQAVAAYYSSLSPSEQAELDEWADFATHEFTHRDSWIRSHPPYFVDSQSQVPRKSGVVQCPSLRLFRTSNRASAEETQR